MNIAVVTDSTAYIPKEMREQHQIHMIPLQVVFGEETYREEIELDWKSFYDEVKKHTELPTTSQPSIGELVALYEELGKSYDAVISIHLSSGISGTFSSAATADTMVDNIEVYPFDSEISCLAQGFYALKAAELIRNGAASPEDIIKELEEMKKTVRAYFMVDDLAHLQRGGRLSQRPSLYWESSKGKAYSSF